MEQELEREVEIATEIKTEQKTSLDDLPCIEDLLKTEKEVKTEKTLEGLTAVKKEVVTENRTFARQVDEKKAFVKRRIKTVTCVFSAVVTLLLAFVGINIVTLINLNKDINSTTSTIKSESVAVDIYKEQASQAVPPTGSYEITLNEPRDYSDDDKELTMLDKISIIFRNLFG